MSETHNHSLPILPGDPAEPGPEGSRFGKAHHVLLGFTALALVVWLLSGIYQVNADEVAIIERMGQYSTTDQGKAIIVGHGLHYHLPWPIDRVHRIATQQVKTLTVKTFNEPPEAYAKFKQKLQNDYMRPEVISAIYDPYLITGDRNMVHMEIAVSYQIDPEAWINTVAYAGDASTDTLGQREEMLQRLVEHAMIEEIATVPVNNILFEERARLPGLLQTAIGKAVQLNDPADPTGDKKIEIGVKIQRVDVVSATAPLVVKDAFDQVFREQQNMETTKSKAEAAKKSVETAAMADKASMEGKAIAYASQTVDTAKGEASRFAAIYEQYKVAPDVTRLNVYVGAVKAMIENSARFMLGQPGQLIWLQIDPPKFSAQQAQQQQQSR